MDSRVDLPAYRKSCRQLRNLIPMKQGGATRRPGTQFIANGKAVAGTPVVSRDEKFQYSPGTTFNLEFCHLGIRFFSNGVQVQAPSPPAWVSGTSYAWGAFVTNGGNTYYAYAGPIINSTTVPGSDTANWVKQTAYEVPAPYSAANFTAPNYWTADVFVLQTKQINNVVYIVHPNFPIWKLTRYTDTNWTMQQVQFLTPALLDQNATDSTLQANALTGTGVGLTANAAVWNTGTYYTPGNAVLENGNIYNCLTIHTSGTFSTDLANGYWKLVTMFQSGHVGSYWQLAYNRPQSYVQYNLTANGTSGSLFLVGTWEVQTYGVWNANISIQASYDGGTTWQNITTLTSAADANYNISGEEISGGLYQMVITGWVTETSATIPRVVLTADNQFVYGLVEITAVADAYDATCTVIVPLYSTNPTIYWSEGAWSGVRGYPQALTVFQERVLYGYSMFQPQRIWGTQTNDIENFALLDQSQATYGMAFDLNAPGRGPIQWLNAQTDLMAGLAGAEWIITSGSPTAAITPTAVIAVEHSVNGSAPYLPGIVISNAAFYVQRKGTNFQQMLFSVFTNKYMSQDMQVLAQHLTAARVKQFDYQQQIQNQSLIWAVCGDGSLVSMTYAMDQEVFGWAKHSTGGGVNATDLFLSVQAIYGAPGQDDEIWVSVLRAGAMSCTIERIDPLDWQTANVGQPQLNQMCYADCSVAVTSPGSNVISGLSTLLAGRLACASIVPAAQTGAFAIQGLTISNTGTVTIPNYVPATGDVVTVGLPINWTLQPMRLDVDIRAGQIPAIKKAIQRLYLRLLNSIGGNWGTAQGEVIPLPAYPITQNSGNPPPFTPNVALDVEIDTAAFTQYEDDPQFFIEGSDPLPFTILGITVKYDIGGAT